MEAARQGFPHSGSFETRTPNGMCFGRLLCKPRAATEPSAKWAKSMWKLEGPANHRGNRDYTLLHVTRPVRLSEQLCYNFSLKHSYASAQLPIYLHEADTVSDITGHIALGSDDHVVLISALFLISLYVTTCFPFLLKNIF